MAEIIFYLVALYALVCALMVAFVIYAVVVYRALKKKGLL